jgi:hypothetical protein
MHIAASDAVPLLLRAFLIVRASMCIPRFVVRTGWLLRY